MPVNTYDESLEADENEEPRGQRRVPLKEQHLGNDRGRSGAGAKRRSRQLRGDQLQERPE